MTFKWSNMKQCFRGDLEWSVFVMLQAFSHKINFGRNWPNVRSAAVGHAENMGLWKTASCVPYVETIEIFRSYGEN
jgi:hypothetical protein